MVLRHCISIIIDDNERKSPSYIKLKIERERVNLEKINISAESRKGKVKKK